MSISRAVRWQDKAVWFNHRGGSLSPDGAQPDAAVERFIDLPALPARL